MKTLVFASNNAHKLEEIRSILGDTYEIKSLQDIGCQADIPETGSTFAENAMLKARYVKEHFGMDCFADDSGLQVAALNGEPGVYSARYAATQGYPLGKDKDDTNMDALLDRLNRLAPTTAPEGWKACFRTDIALIYEGKECHFDGVVDGHIIREKRGQGGFGYDPLFVPEGHTQTFAELGTEVKNTMSHRARAVAKLAQYLKVLLLLLLPALVAGCKKGASTETNYVSAAPIFCEDSAYQYVAEQCAFGPRVMNTAAHDSCGNYIAQRFEQFGATVYNQYADAQLYDGTPIRLRNIIASFNPQATTRIIICGHWDSRPWADHDPNEANHRTPIDGANDGGSSTGVMLELARQLQQDQATRGDSALFAMRPGLGIDFICWDAEDCGTPSFDDDGEGHESTWCLGSQYWAGHRHVEGYTARYAINLDMVGNEGSIFCREGYSMHYAPTVVDKVWGAAQRIGYSQYFSYDDRGGYVTDDHVQVNQGGIPCIDVIGCDAENGGFPATWHTVNDNLQHISRATLKAVGQTMLEVIWTEQ